MLTLNKQRVKLTNSSQPASLPLEAYAGTYRHPFLGKLTIQLEGEGLTFIFGEIYQGKLPHANHNTFFREPEKPICCRSQFRGPLRFNLSVEGSVESLKINEGEFLKETA